MRRVSPNTWRWQHRDEIAPVWPGHHQQLGATWSPTATNFAIRSPEATACWVCLFDDDGHRDPPPAHRAHPRRLARPDPRRAGRPALRLPGRRPVGPRRTAAGSTPPSCCSTPTPARSPARSSPARRRSPTTRTTRCSAATLDSAGAMPRSVVVHDEFDWEGDDHLLTRWRDTVIYELHVKGYTQLHNEIPEHQRGTYAGLGSDTVIRYLKDLGVSAVELLPVHHFLTEPSVADARDGELLGLQLDRLLRPARGLLVLRRPRPAGDRVQADGEELPPRRDRGDPRRGLQPHGRGRHRRADVLLPRARRPRLLQARPAPATTPTGTSPGAATPSTPPTAARCG